MREIKFRGRDICTGEWLYGDLRQRAGCLPSIIRSFCNNGKLDYCETPIHRDSLGQFTGITDKNGKEIYEGDIIRSDCGNGEVRHLISFFDIIASFVAEMLPDNDINDYCALSQIWISKYNKEVIGNIHDNPELLK